MKILVTGANGLLGQHLVKILVEKKYQVIGLGRGPARHLHDNPHLFRYYDADIAEEQPLHDIMKQEQPEIVVHAAAMTQVDECELNQDACFQVNVRGTLHAIVDAEQFSRFFIYISTDFVFSGADGNYREEDAMQPVNWYGYTKTEAEALVNACAIPWAIVRTCLVYGNSLRGTRSNIINWAKAKLSGGEKIKVVDDQVRTPTYVEDLALGILLVIEKKATGIFHLSGRDTLTPYDMVRATASYFDLDQSLVERVDASNFTQAAKRPSKTGFIIDKAIHELGFRPGTFEEGLKKMFDH